MFFANNLPNFFEPQTRWVAAEVFSDLGDWYTFSETVQYSLAQLIDEYNLIEGTYEEYRAHSIEFHSFMSMAMLAIVLAESMEERLFVPNLPCRSRVMETMLFLVDTELSSRTFNFWISFAENSSEIEDKQQGYPWLEQAFTQFFMKMCESGGDEMEWLSYRADVIEVFESILCMLGPAFLNSAVQQALDSWVFEPGNTGECSEDSLQILVVYFA